MRSAVSSVVVVRGSGPIAHCKFLAVENCQKIIFSENCCPKVQNFGLKKPFWGNSGRIGNLPQSVVILLEKFAVPVEKLQLFDSQCNGTVGRECALCSA